MQRAERRNRVLPLLLDYLGDDSATDLVLVHQAGDGCLTELDVFTELAWLSKQIVKFLEEFWQEVVQENVARSTILTQVFADVVTQKTADINLNLALVDCFLEFVCSELALFTDQIVGSINLVHVPFCIQQSNSVESFDLLVATEMDVLADGVRVFQVWKQLLDDEIQLADKDLALVFVRSLVAQSTQEDLQLSQFGRIICNFDDAFDQRFAFSADRAESRELRNAILVDHTGSVIIDGSPNGDTQSNQKNQFEHGSKSKELRVDSSPRNTVKVSTAKHTPYKQRY